jgi:hypothetical protein
MVDSFIFVLHRVNTNAAKRFCGRDIVVTETRVLRPRPPPKSAAAVVAAAEVGARSSSLPKKRPTKVKVYFNIITCRLLRHADVAMRLLTCATNRMRFN